jgi:hypothetical protein
MKKLLVCMAAVFALTLSVSAISPDVLELPDYYEDYDDVNVYIPEDKLADSADDEAGELPGQTSLAAVGVDPEIQDDGEVNEADSQTMGFGIVAGALMGASFMFQWKPGVI